MPKSEDAKGHVEGRPLKKEDQTVDVPSAKGDVASAEDAGGKSKPVTSKSAG